MKRLMVFLVTTVMLSAAGAAHAAQLIKIDGSSTVYPITEAVAEEFQKVDRGKTRITSGSPEPAVVLRSSAAGRRISAMPQDRSSPRRLNSARRMG